MRLIITIKFTAIVLVFLAITIIANEKVFAFECGPNPDSTFCEEDAKNCSSMDINWWEEFEKSNGDYEKVFKKFQEKMNEQFVEQIELMTDEISECDPKFDSSKVFNFKGNEEGENFAKKVMLDKAKYQCAIVILLQSDKIKTENIIGEISDIFKGNNAKEKELILEIETTGKSVIVAIEALSELQIAYLIHKKLQCVIEALNTVRLRLKDYVGEIVKINGKFINCGFQD